MSVSIALAVPVPVVLNAVVGEDPAVTITRVFGKGSLDSADKVPDCPSHDAKHFTVVTDNFDGLAKPKAVFKFSSHGDLDLDCLSSDEYGQQKSGRTEIKTPRQSKKDNVKVAYENDKTIWRWNFKLLNAKAPDILESSLERFKDNQDDDADESLTTQNNAKFYHVFQAKPREFKDAFLPQNLPAAYKERYIAAGKDSKKQNDVITEFKHIFDPKIRLSLKQRLKKDHSIYDAFELNYVDDTLTFYTLDREDLNAFTPSINNHWYQAELKATWADDGQMEFNIYPLKQAIDAKTGEKIAVSDTEKPVVTVKKRLDLWDKNFESIYPKIGLYFGRVETAPNSGIFHKGLPDNEMLISDVILMKE